MSDITKFGDKYRTVLLIAITAFLFADQNLLAPSLSEVAIDFDIADEDKDIMLGGYIALGFFLVGAPVSLGIGFAVDFVNRRKLFAATVIFGELACAMTYFVNSYEQLFAARALTGTSIGGALPLLLSMFGDIYPEEKRGRISGIIGVSMAAGAGVGQMVATVMLGLSEEGERPDWRSPFVIVSIPSLILTVVFMFVTSDPQRGRAENALKDQFEAAEARGDTVEYSEKLTKEKFKAMWKNKTTLLLFAQGIPGSIPWGVMIAYFTDFLINNRAQSAGGAFIATLGFAFGIAIGQGLGGVIGDYVYQFSPRYVCYLMSITTLTGVYPLLWAINEETVDGLMYTIILFPVGILISITGSNVKSILLNVSLPEIRGTAAGVFNLMDDLGRGLGPFGVGVLIQLSGSRVAGFNLALIGWVVCGLVLFFMSFTLEADIDSMNEVLKDLDLNDVEVQSNGIVPLVETEDGKNPKMSI
jgi:MFS family permease